MTEQQSGLRFDIYERVHLSEGVAGIKELDEIELVPHIQVYPDNDQAVLKGNLYLTGTYAGEQEDGSRTLEHFIPVEITLPLNRIHDLDEVGVEIENFDVDLLSSRSLNVTGVLTLHGIEMISQADDAWREEEEVTFVHEARQPDESYGDISNRVPKSTKKIAGKAPAKAGGKAPATKPNSADLFEEGNEGHQDEVTETPETNEFQDLFAEFGAANPFAEAANPEEEKAEEQEENKKQADMKIGFGAKQEENVPNYLKSLLHKEDTRLADSEAEASQAQLAQAQAAKAGSTEIKRLFTSGREGGQQFSRMRICIVQKEETLDGIAKRYNLNPREILLYNRIEGTEVGQGQVLYIPR